MITVSRNWRISRRSRSGMYTLINRLDHCVRLQSKDNGRAQQAGDGGSGRVVHSRRRAVIHRCDGGPFPVSSWPDPRWRGHRTPGGWAVSWGTSDPRQRWETLRDRRLLAAVWVTVRYDTTDVSLRPAATVHDKALIAMSSRGLHRPSVLIASVTFTTRRGMNYISVIRCGQVVRLGDGPWPARGEGTADYS
jgi:hypothetical protein